MYVTPCDGNADVVYRKMARRLGEMEADTIHSVHHFMHKSHLTAPNTMLQDLFPPEILKSTAPP
jgi:hypothetical protein